MNRILAVFGTRRGFLKVAALLRVVRKLQRVNPVFAGSRPSESPICVDVCRTVD